MQNSDSGVDPAVELIIQRMTDLVDARVLALKKDLIEQFGARHDELARRLTEATENFDRWATDIRRATNFTQAMAKGAFAGDQPSPAPLTPTADAPRPIAIDRAAAADPSAGEQRVDLPDYGVVLYIKPGEDPERAWVGTRTALREERGVGGVRRSPRTRRR